MKVFERLPHINFMKYKGMALVVSWGIIIFCFMCIQPWKGSNSKIKLGMQFTGGIDMTVAFKGNIYQDQVRTALYNGGIHDAGVVAYQDNPEINLFSIKIKATKNQSEQESSAQIKKVIDIIKQLDSKDNNNRLDLNTESAGTILDNLIKSNPLNLNLQETEIYSVYSLWVDKIIKVREKLITISNYNQLPQDLPIQLRRDLESKYRLGNVSVLKNESFSPSISSEWTWKTIKAIFWAISAILVYVLLRFTISFSIGGIIALLHDVLMALGLFVLFGFEFSIPVVASFLILMGYSMTDTIVVFDRIRENSHKLEYKKADITTLVNDSINQTLSRTILSSLSVLFIALCLFIWGGRAMRDLSFPILIGVITGTYSSIFIASSMVVYWDYWFNKTK